MIKKILLAILALISLFIVIIWPDIKRMLTDFGFFEDKFVSYPNVKKLKETQKLCRENDLNSCLEWGVIEKKYGELKKAKILFKRVCDEGIFKGCFQLAMIEKYLGRNSTAAKLFQKACEKKINEACYFLSVMLGEEGKYEMAKSLLINPCLREHEKSCVELSYLELKLDNSKEAQRILLELCRKGFRRTCYKLATIKYLNNDLERAFILYKRGLFTLIKDYSLDDIKMAKDLFKQLCEKDKDPEKCGLYGHLASKTGDFVFARHFLTKACELQNKGACLDLKLMEETNKSRQEKIGNLTAKCDAGDDRSCYEVTKLFIFDPIIYYRNAKEGIRYAKKALNLKYIPKYLDILAAAYAEDGDFLSAAGQEEKAHSMTSLLFFKGNKEYLLKIKFYQNNKKYREQQRLYLER